MIRSLNTFIYDGVSLSEFGAAITQRPTRIVSVRDINFSSAPFKSGDLLIDNGRYENKEFRVPIRTLPAYCKMSLDEFSDKLLEWLTPGGVYKEKIYRDTYKLGYYRKGTVTKIENIVAVKRDVYETAIHFNFNPYLYNDIGTEKLSYSTIDGTISKTIRNPEKWESEPIIVINGNGTYEITVNGGSLMYVTVTSGKIFLDKTQENVYDASGNSRNSYVSGMRLPFFNVGENDIVVEATDDRKDFSIDIIPNWRRL